MAQDAGQACVGLRLFGADIRYYRIFTSLYSLSLLFAEEIMTNSSWTQAHLTSLITSARSSFSASIFLLDNKSYEQRAKTDTSRIARKGRCEVVFPPCDTEALEALGKLDKRKRQIVSLAQFRWVKRLRLKMS